MEELLNLLKEIKPSIDFSKEKTLIEDGILDSFDIVQIVTRMKNLFGVKIRPTDVIPENFNSAETMWKLLESLGE